MKAFGYVRLSRSDRESTSPQKQRAILGDLCRVRGWELVQTFEDLDASGGRESRPGLDAMLSRLGEADVLVVWKLDRLARSLSHLLKLVQTFETAGVQLVTSDGEVDTTTAAGKAFYQMRGVFAEFERNTVSERAKGMHAYLKANGRVQSRVPFGWRKGEAGKFVPVEAEQKQLRQMATRFAQGHSLRDVGRAFGMEHTSVRHMLRSDKVLEALPADLASDVRAEMRNRGPNGRRPTKSLLSGIAVCGVCGGAMKVFTRRPSARTGSWAAYGCREKGHTYISQHWLDEYVSSSVVAAIPKLKLAQRFGRKQPRKAGDIEARLERLEDDYYQRGLLSEKSYLRQREGLLKRLEAARDEPPRQANLPRELALHLDERWGDLTVGERRKIISLVLEAVQVNRATTKARVEPDRVKLIQR